jgi:leucyl/phenylalanyl-tRNA--protein transferase
VARAFPVYLPADAPPRFPDPSRCDAEGLVAVGGDLSSPRLLAAYRAGIFPWFDDRVPPLWWSPDPRTVITAESLHVARRLARTMRTERFAITWDRAFDRVMLGCAQRREDGTWITADMRSAYGELHALGHAHSLEVWAGAALVGGIYGVHVGGVFAGESMFHRVADASKVALVALASFAFGSGVELLDVQLTTEHLVRMGAVELSRKAYLARVAALRDRAVVLRWGDDPKYRRRTATFLAE